MLSKLKSYLAAESKGCTVPNIRWDTGNDCRISSVYTGHDCWISGQNGRTDIQLVCLFRLSGKSLSGASLLKELTNNMLITDGKSEIVHSLITKKRSSVQRGYNLLYMMRNYCNKAGHATTLPQPRDHVFRSNNCGLFPYGYNRCGYSI